MQYLIGFVTGVLTTCAVIVVAWLYVARKAELNADIDRYEKEECGPAAK